MPSRSVKALLLAFLCLLLVGCSAPPLVIKRIPARVRVYVPLIRQELHVVRTVTAKKGLTLAYDGCEDVLAVAATWQYAWWHVARACPDVDDVPMIYSDRQANATVAGDSKYLLMLNEPDREDQGYTTVDAAAIAQRIVEQRNPKRLLISEATSIADPDHLARVRKAYIAAYGQTPRWHALAVHCYLNTAWECIEYTRGFIRLADQWGVYGGVWVTEFSFGTNGRTLAATLRELAIFGKWLEGELRVGRYAYFTNRVWGNEPWAWNNYPCLLGEDGLTEAGLLYAALPN